MQAAYWTFFFLFCFYDNLISPNLKENLYLVELFLWLPTDFSPAFYYLL